MQDATHLRSHSRIRSSWSRLLIVAAMTGVVGCEPDPDEPTGEPPLVDGLWQLEKSADESGLDIPPECRAFLDRLDAAPLLRIVQTGELLTIYVDGQPAEGSIFDDAGEGPPIWVIRCAVRLLVEDEEVLLELRVTLSEDETSFDGPSEWVLVDAAGVELCSGVIGISGSRAGWGRAWTSAWSVHTEERENCSGEESLSSDDFLVDVLHEGDHVTVASPIWIRSGTIVEDSLELSGQHEEHGGITTETIVLTLSADLQSFTGTSTWTWTNGWETCEGTTEVTGVRDE